MLRAVSPRPSAAGFLLKKTGWEREPSARGCERTYGKHRVGCPKLLAVRSCSQPVVFSEKLTAVGRTAQSPQLASCLSSRPERPRPRLIMSLLPTKQPYD
jgi:hypothetical protein